MSSVLVVCTGNICRSPVAERLLTDILGPDVAVTSAGTRALSGQQIAPPMAARLTRDDVKADGFTARQLTSAVLRDAGLVLGMTREHRAAAVALWPASVRRAFTLREFARLLGSHEGAPAPRLTGWADIVTYATSQRGRRLVTVEDDSIADPYQRADGAYDVAYQQIVQAVAAIAAFVDAHLAPATRLSRPGVTHRPTLATAWTEPTTD